MREPDPTIMTSLPDGKTLHPQQRLLSKEP